MAHRVLDLTLISASDLKYVNFISPMAVYAVASLYGDPLSRQCTPSDLYGGTNPTWNTTLRFEVPPTAASAKGVFLHVLLRTERPLGDRDVGEVFVPIGDFLVGGACAGVAGGVSRPRQHVSYDVRKVSCTEHYGTLSLSYRLGPIMAPLPDFPAAGGCDSEVLTYEMPPWYPRPYVYSPWSMPAICGSAPAASQRKKKGRNMMNTFGFGWLGGAIGGMLEGDMLSPERAAYDAGHNAGLTEGEGGATFQWG